MSMPRIHPNLRTPASVLKIYLKLRVTTSVVKIYFNLRTIVSVGQDKTQSTALDVPKKQRFLLLELFQICLFLWNKQTAREIYSL